MKFVRILSAVILCAGLWCIGQASAYWQSRDSNYNIAVSASGCSQATTLNNALDGGQNVSKVTTLVCNMVTHGTYSLILGLYMAATNSIGNSEINWANPGTFNLIKNGTVTFNANANWTGFLANSSYFDTTFVPSLNGGTTLTLNSTSMGSCTSNSRTVSQYYVTLGSSTGNVNYIYHQPLASSKFFYDINGSTSFPSFSTANSQGGWISSRNGSATQSALYQNGSAVAGSPFADVSTGLSSNSIFVGALNNGSSTDFSADSIVYAFYGGGLTAAQAASVYSDLNTYSGC